MYANGNNNGCTLIKRILSNYIFHVIFHFVGFTKWKEISTFEIQSY